MTGPGMLHLYLVSLTVAAPPAEAPAAPPAMEVSPVESDSEPDAEPGTGEDGNPNFSDEPAEAPDLEFAEEGERPPEMDYAEAPTPEPEMDYAAEDQPTPAPPPEAVERQSTVNLAEDADPRADPNYESPQRFAIELKFGPYLPDVDARYEGSGYGPYAEIFGETNKAGEVNGDPRKGLMAKLGFEWQFYHLGGPFLLGTSVGFFQDRADALLAEPGDADSVRSDADRVRFNVVPLSLDVGYRFELLADRFKVPLVPYAKGGIAYGFWWSKAGGRGVTENSAGVKGRGGSIGWQASLGLMLRLDFLERGTARELDRSTGINHTYIFGEYQLTRLDGFGGALEKVSVGDDTFYLGLAIEF